jgi:hypothetical protein
MAAYTGARRLVIASQQLTDTNSHAVTLAAAGAAGYIKARSGNTGTILIGKSSSNAEPNVKLAASEVLSVLIDEATTLYAKASSANDWLEFVGDASE